MNRNVITDLVLMSMQINTDASWHNVLFMTSCQQEVDAQYDTTVFAIKVLERMQPNSLTLF